jgi:DNA-directed RNA polymerase specialized sigma24 family protein
MIEKAKEKDKSAYQSWSEEMDIELTMLYCEKKTLKELAAHFRRSQGAIKSRIKKLELPELYG